MVLGCIGINIGSKKAFIRRLVRKQRVLSQFFFDVNLPIWCIFNQITPLKTPGQQILMEPMDEWYHILERGPGLFSAVTFNKTDITRRTDMYYNGHVLCFIVPFWAPRVTKSLFFYINEHLSKTIEISVKFYLPPFISVYILIWVIGRRKFIKVECCALFKKMLFCYLGKTEGNVITFMKLFLFLKPLFLARPVQWASHWFLEGEGERLISLPASPPWKHFARAARCSWTQFQ